MDNLNRNSNLLQQTGGIFNMDYDQEGIYYKLNSLSYNVQKTFNMMINTAFAKYDQQRANVDVC